MCSYMYHQPSKFYHFLFLFTLFAVDVWWLIATFFSFEDLTRHLVCDYAAIEHLMQQGNTHRYLYFVWEILSKQLKTKSWSVCILHPSIEKESILKCSITYVLCAKSCWKIGSIKVRNGGFSRSHSEGHKDSFTCHCIIHS